MVCKRVQHKIETHKEIIDFIWPGFDDDGNEFALACAVLSLCMTRGDNFIFFFDKQRKLIKKKKSLIAVTNRALRAQASV